MEILSKKEEVAGMISVVIPVYNVEKYLAECLDSVLSQTFKNYEVLLVDDGSPDSSGQICDNYASKDARIRVFHKENGGVSSARKLGVENARGEWIVFVDSDDKLFPNSLEDLFHFSKNFPQADLIEGGFVREDCYEEITGEPVLVSAEKYLVEATKWKLFHFAILSKMFRKSILLEANALSFPKWIYHGEDDLMCFRFATKAHHFLSIPRLIYFYRDNPNSVSNSTKRKATYTLAWLKEAEKILSVFPREVFISITKFWASSIFFTSTTWRGERIDDPYFHAIIAELWAHRERFSIMTRVMLLAIKIPFPWLRRIVRFLLLKLARIISFLRSK